MVCFLLCQFVDFRSFTGAELRLKRSRIMILLGVFLFSFSHALTHEKIMQTEICRERYTMRCIQMRTHLK